MQGGKNWILPKEINATLSSETLVGWKSGKTTYVPLYGTENGGSRAMGSAQCTGHVSAAKSCLARGHCAAVCRWRGGGTGQPLA
jgi:hypothetical protein